MVFESLWWLGTQRFEYFKNFYILKTPCEIKPSHATANNRFYGEKSKKSKFKSPSAAEGLPQAMQKGVLG